MIDSGKIFYNSGSSYLCTSTRTVLLVLVKLQPYMKFISTERGPDFQLDFLNKIPDRSVCKRHPNQRRT